MISSFEVMGDVPGALFTLKVRRGEGMALLSMNWKVDEPPVNFVGFAIECQPPSANEFFALQNRLSFAGADGNVDPGIKSSRLSPIQKFRWIHFPQDAEVDGEFKYRVTPVLMGDDDALSYGTAQTAAIVLGGETYPGELNVAFTRGFVSSQAFVDRYSPEGEISTLLPTDPKAGLDFEPTHPKAAEALTWMGFEAREAILAALDHAIADDAAQVRVVAYDLNQREVVDRLKQLGSRLKVIIDDSGSHGDADSAETTAAQRLATTAGAGNVKRQHMGNLQHNKTIAVKGPQGSTVVCGSTNFSWRGFFVQANNAVVVHSTSVVDQFLAAFDDYWQHDDVAGFGATDAANLTGLELDGIDAQIAFSPHISRNKLLPTIATDIQTHTESSLLYSLAFLYQTTGPIRTAIETVTADNSKFVYGISDRRVGGLDLQKPGGNVAPVFPEALSAHVPEPFKSEPTGGSGIRMHHKFVVIDFEKPTARVYLGSYNFSGPADTENGENLLEIKDRRIAVSYAVEALQIFDHYHFRVNHALAQQTGEPLELAKPPRTPDKKPWWDEYYTKPEKIRDREIFA